LKACQSLANYINSAITREQGGETGAIKQGFRLLHLHGFNKVLDQLVANSESETILLPSRPALQTYQVKFVETRFVRYLKFER
jgi:hypothetical protein